MLTPTRTGGRSVAPGGWFVGAEAEALELAGSEILDHGVGFAGEPQHYLARFGSLEVESDAALVASMHGPPQGFTVDLLAPPPDRVSRSRLDLDHVCAEIGEQARAEGGGDKMTDLQDANSGQRRPGRPAAAHGLGFNLSLPR